MARVRTGEHDRSKRVCSADCAGLFRAAGRTVGWAPLRLPLFRHAVERRDDQLSMGKGASDHADRFGPAAGVNGAAIVGELCGEPNVIYLDIGGTTAKCSTLSGGQPKITTEYKLEWTRTKFGYPVRTPVVDMLRSVPEVGPSRGSIKWARFTLDRLAPAQIQGPHPIAAVARSQQLRIRNS